MFVALRVLQENAVVKIACISNFQLHVVFMTACCSIIFYAPNTKALIHHF